ncbi:MAG: glycosyltransferase family 87 protein [Paracoccaceae bacterium]
MSFTPSRLASLILLAGFLGSFYWFFPTHSADLMATWLAGNFLAAGQPDQVYPTLTEYFQMYPPDQWRPFMAQEYKYEGPMFPYLYPPLWAKLAGWFVNINFWRLSAVALVINSALLMATILLAYRATRTALNPALYVGMALFFLLSNFIGTVALVENQPQIFVSFLLVLTMERIRNNAPISAGAALAIAAAIKIYPVIFALLLIFGRERKAFASFVVFGAALGLLSLMWAGWPLHKTFLELTRLISASVLVASISFNFDAVIGQVFFADHLVWLPGLEAPTPASPSPGWYSMARPDIWRILSTFALLVAIALLSRVASRVDRSTFASVLWPLAMMVVALFSPIAWSIYYIPAACFAPVLIEKLGPKLGTVFLVLPFGLIFSPLVKYYRLMRDTEYLPVHYPYQLAGVLAMVILALGFALAVRKSLQIENQAL